MEALLQLFITFALLIGAYFVGTAIEKGHFKRIRRREEATREMVVVSMKTVPSEWEFKTASLVCGNVVVSLDYFKRFLAGLRAIFGGRIKSYEPLLDRARREAILRMKDQAAAMGSSVIVNVRLETSRLASSKNDGKGTAGVEVLAFGTALKKVVPPTLPS